MKVVRAKHSGVCYGVKRALDMAEEALVGGGPTYTLGPLIHNPRVVESLKARGVEVAEHVDDVAAGTVVIRSHGVEPSVLKRLESRGLSVVDATCPHVARAHKSAAELRESCATVLVIGRAEHPEVKGICAHAGENVCVIAGVEGLPEALSEPVGIVVQTTESPEALDAVVGALRARGIEPRVKNTICSATRQRQDDAAALADTVDAIVVIGGKNSSNTTHLFEICERHCARAFFVESADELDASWFSACSVVGVTAGASTPDDQICAVVDYLETL